MLKPEDDEEADVPATEEEPDSSSEDDGFGLGGGAAAAKKKGKAAAEKRKLKRDQHPPKQERKADAEAELLENRSADDDKKNTTRKPEKPEKPDKLVAGAPAMLEWITKVTPMTLWSGGSKALKDCESKLSKVMNMAVALRATPTGSAQAQSLEDCLEKVSNWLETIQLAKDDVILTSDPDAVNLGKGFATMLSSPESVVCDCAKTILTDLGKRLCEDRGGV